MNITYIMLYEKYTFKKNKLISNNSLHFHLNCGVLWQQICNEDEQQTNILVLIHPIILLQAYYPIYLH